ncbi:MAG: RNA polymerase subunit sigma-54 [Deltaproteobacteria bacterium HGW-Deltaproteobacteria-21]|nr:MAG: RNA polymerase subunit sigma-54 [Deltaproteobacteria bacterium HGW-Deltaproteobacteria-21]
MPFKSLKSKLLLLVSAFVVGSGLLISVFITQRYSASLLETMMAQGENIAHAIALEATDQVLINDLVALQKMLDHHIRSHNAVAYLFIQRDQEILAHTFPDGVPIDLIEANNPDQAEQRHLQRVVSTKGKHYLDIAWPVFEGKAGVLRLGISETPYLKKIRSLWLQMSLLTSGILVLSIIGVTLFLRRVTNPLSELAKATERIDGGDMSIRIRDMGSDEVGRLAGSFNRMTARVQDYTHRLEVKASELERANQQARTFCQVIQQIGSLKSLSEIGSYLIGRFRTMLPNGGQMALLLLCTERDRFFVLYEDGMKLIAEEKQVTEIRTRIGEMRKPGLIQKTCGLRPPGTRDGSRCVLVPIRDDEEPLGGLLVLCREGLDCEAKDLDALPMILAQSAGVMRRAVLHEEEAQGLRQRFETSAEFAGMIGRDPKIQAIYMMIEDIAPTDTTVLIQGESGTGKEMVARAIHHLSGRKEKPFVVIDCSAYAETLLESELFGHEKGAFTGATRQKAGRFEQADGGTVFLDEIGEISPSAQIKLLRVLQTQRFERLGGEKTLNVDIRILAATNKDLLQEVKSGRFREDLYYRLNVIPIQVPPLRERRNDIPLLARNFLRRFTTEQTRVIGDFSPEAMRVLLNYAWPGNVRELENSIEHATVLTKGSRVDVSDLPCSIVAAGKNHSTRENSLFPSIAENEKDLLVGALDKCGWNKKEVAKKLGISRNTLYQKLKRHNIARPSTH